MSKITQEQQALEDTLRLIAAGGPGIYGGSPVVPPPVNAPLVGTVGGLPNTPSEEEAMHISIGGQEPHEADKSRIRQYLVPAASCVFRDNAGGSDPRFPTVVYYGGLGIFCTDDMATIGRKLNSGQKVVYNA